MAITHPNQPQHWQPEMTKIIDGRPVRFRDVCVHEIRMGDVEDPELYAAEPLLAWQNSEMGKWVMDHSVQVPMWHRQLEPMQYHYIFAIQAWLKGKDYTYWCMKWGPLTQP